MYCMRYLHGTEVVSQRILSISHRERTRGGQKCDRFVQFSKSSCAEFDDVLPEAPYMDKHSVRFCDHTCRL